MNLSPLVDGSVTLLSAVLTACIPVMLLKLNQAFNLHLDSAHKATLETALDNAVGKGLSFGQAAGDAYLSNVTIKNAALSSMVSYVTAMAPDAVAHFGLSDADLAEKAAAKLGKALHVPATPDAAPTANATASMLEAAATAPTPAAQAASAPVPIQTGLTASAPLVQAS